MLNQVALVSQTAQVDLAELTTASAAVNKQVTRDFAPIWNIEASVDAFASLDQVPLGYYPVIIRDDIPYDAQGIHLNSDDGHPYSLVQYSTNWALTVSHETLEMLADPSGNRTVAGNSVKPGQGRVLYLVEVCDPSEGAHYGYTLNGVLLSDFYTPHYFDPVTASGVQYSYTGAIKEPRQVLDGGYLSWFDPVSKHVFQLFVEGTKKQFVDQGPMPDGFKSLREFSDRVSTARRGGTERTGTPRGLMMTSRLGSSERAPKSLKSSLVDLSVAARAASLQAQIDKHVSKKK